MNYDINQVIQILKDMRENVNMTLYQWGALGEAINLLSRQRDNYDNRRTENG